MGETTANGHFQFTSDAAARNVEFKANIDMHVNRHWGDAQTMGSEENGIGFTITEPMHFSLAQQCLFEGLGRDHMSYRLRSVDFTVNHEWTIGEPVPGGYFEAPPRSGVIPVGEYVFRFGFAMTNNPNANPSSTPVVSADGFVSLNLSPVPEPSGIAAAAVGCVSWMLRRRRGNVG